MRKHEFCICENKGSDHLCSKCTAGQRLCLRYMDSSIALLPKSKHLIIYCGCTDRFVSDLVGTPKTSFLASRLNVITKTNVFWNTSILLKTHFLKSEKVTKKSKNLKLTLSTCIGVHLHVSQKYSMFAMEISNDAFTQNL